MSSKSILQMSPSSSYILSCVKGQEWTKQYAWPRGKGLTFLNVTIKLLLMETKLKTPSDYSFQILTAY